MAVPPFRIKSKIGVFDVTDGSTSANGCDLSVFVTEAEDSFEYFASFNKTGSDGEVSFSKNMSGTVQDAGLLTIVLSAWMDSFADEVLEDYSDDVKYFQTTRGKIAYFCYNTNIDAIPVIFVHGGPGGDCNPVKGRRMLLDHPVYMYDQMGCGRSDKIEDLDNWGLQEYVEELEQFINGLGFEKVILIGASWGAGLCAAYAEYSHCEKIAAMVLPSPFFGSKSWADDQLTNLKNISPEMYGEMLKYIDTKVIDDRFYEIMGEYYANFLFCRAKHREIAIAAAREVYPDVFLKLWGPMDMVCTGNLRDFDVEPRLNEIDVPVLFLCGDSDEITIETMRRYQSKVKGSRFSVVPFAGHVLGMEQFDAYRECIKAFLDEFGY